jgi:hypothetical protein
MARDFPENCDIFAAFFGGFWPDFPMISQQSGLEKKANFLGAKVLQ